MKKVYLIRHGLPDFPAGERMCLGITDLPMGEAGLAQAAKMAEKLPAVTAVFSSPLTRAVQTAEDIDFIVAFAQRMADAKHCPVARQMPDNMKEKLDEYLARKRPKNQ